MAKIQLAQFTPKGTPQTGVRADTNLLSAEGAGMKQFGKGLDDVGKVIQQLGMKKAKAIADGQIAGEKIIRAGIDADIKNFAENNPGDAKAMREYSAQRITEYEKEFSTRKSDQGWSNMAVDSDKIELDYWKKASQIQTENVATKIEIAESNALVAQNAQRLFEDWKFDDAIAEVDKMVAAPSDKEALKKKLAEAGTARVLQREISATLNSPPADAAKALSDIEDDLLTKGSYRSGGYGLSQQERLLQLDNVRKARAQADQAMNTTGVKLMERMAKGEPLNIIQSAVDAGSISLEKVTDMMPLFLGAEEEGDVYKAERLRKKQEAEAKDAAALLSSRRTQVSNRESMRKKLANNDLTRAQIDKQVLLDGLSPADGIDLHRSYDVASNLQRQSDTYTDLKESVGWAGWRMLGANYGLILYPGMIGNTDATYRKMVDKITMSGLNPEVQRELIHDLMVSHSLDVSNGDEDMNWTPFDRTVTDTEQELHRDLKTVWKTAGRSINPPTVGNMWVEQLTQIRIFFDENPDPSDETFKRFRDNLFHTAFGAEVDALMNTTK